MEKIKFKSVITIEGLPIKWLPKLEFFYPDLPGFPIMYVHAKVDDTRVYGFPVSIDSVDYTDDLTCSVNILFLSNKDLDANLATKELVKEELNHRIGLSDPITKEDILESCRDDRFKPFFSDLWDIASNLYGHKLPYGKFYEEIYSIVRFVSAFQPKTGRQSEMRMLYNFLSIFGEQVKISSNTLKQWSFLEFYVLPTYKDYLEDDIDEFTQFKKLNTAVQKLWAIEFNQVVTIGGENFKSLRRAWPQNKDEFMKEKTIPLVNSGNFTAEDRHQIDRLVDAFNRLSWRAGFFIWSLCTAKEQNYQDWDKDFFTEFYTNACNIKGCSEKVVACFLQQGFLKQEVIPLDIWINTFYEYALGIPTKECFFELFDNLGKIERLIWLTSQANKTNMRDYMELLWCTRYGTNGNGNLREMNPLSCYECKLRNVCQGYNSIKNEKIYFTEDDFQIHPIKNRKGEITSLDIMLSENITSKNCLFVCVNERNIPKKIYKRYKKKNQPVLYQLIDEFSGYLLKEEHVIGEQNCIYDVDVFISKLPEFSYTNENRELF